MIRPHIRWMIRRDMPEVLLWTDEHRGECLRTLGRWASTPDLSLTMQEAYQAKAKIDADYPLPEPERSVLPALCVGAVSGALIGLAITLAAVFAAWGMV